ncbi:MAG TPA: deaminase [Rhizomicrobium sp.]|jgi:dCMP deaminase
MSEQADRDYLALAHRFAGASPDPSTKVGALLVDAASSVVAIGHNCFPEGVACTSNRLDDRETKLRLIVHAEMNAILAAARAGVSTKDCVLYLAATDASGQVWGGAPCVRCTVEIIQSGVREIVSYPQKAGFSKWHADLAEAKDLLVEAGIVFREVLP